MDTSAKTASTDAYASLIFKNSDKSDSDNISDREENNFRQNDVCEGNHCHCDKLDNSPKQIISENVKTMNNNNIVKKQRLRKMKLRGEFLCRLCLTIFPSLRALKGHNKIHLSAAASGPYQCNLCSFSSRYKAAVITHMRTHNGDRRYECSLCNYTFATKGNCERHLRNQHGKVTREDVKSCVICNPSEDSSCNDPAKKMEIYNSSDDDKAVTSNDRTSLVTALEDIAARDTVKIKVKSLDQLMEPTVTDRDKDVQSVATYQRSMDVLDHITKDEHFSKIDPSTHYVQLPQLHRNITFSTARFPIYKDFHPKNRRKVSMLQPILTGSQICPPPPGPATNISTHGISQTNEMQQRSASPQEHVKSPQVTNNSPQHQLQLPSSTEQTNLIHNSAPVKMVIKNDVLMPKQKRPRYRTEHPFASEHCSTKFTLKTNMIRHIRQYHPQYWVQKRILKRISASNNHGKLIMPSAHPLQLPPQPMTNQLSSISDQVKYATQLKYHTERPSKYLKSMDGSAMATRDDADTAPTQPQYWVQKRCYGPHILKRISASNNHGKLIMPSAHPLQLPPQPMTNQLSSISDQVKYATQLKYHTERPSKYLKSMDGSAMTTRNDADTAPTQRAGPDSPLWRPF